MSAAINPARLHQRSRRKLTIEAACELAWAIHDRDLTHIPGTSQSAMSLMISAAGGYFTTANYKAVMAWAAARIAAKKSGVTL